MGARAIPNTSRTTDGKKGLTSHHYAPLLFLSFMHRRAQHLVSLKM